MSPQIRRFGGLIVLKYEGLRNKTGAGGTLRPVKAGHTSPVRKVPSLDQGGTEDQEGRRISLQLLRHLPPTAKPLSCPALHKRIVSLSKSKNLSARAKLCLLSVRLRMNVIDLFFSC